MMRMKHSLIALVLAAGCASAPRPAVRSVGFAVGDAGRAERFLTGGLSFAPDDGGGALRLGTERLRLLARPGGAGRALPADSRSNDLWFEHVAIVVSDMDQAHARLRELGVTPISAEPQTIPASNPAAAGIRAFYFQDADGHPLELIWSPRGKGAPRGQAHDRLFLGIDHTAIAVASTEKSLAFYRDLLGLRVAGGSLNEGIEQERLSGVEGARVRITGLRAGSGPGVELLEDLSPGPGRPAPADTSPRELWYWEISIGVHGLSGLADRLRAAGVVVAAERGELVVRDPDGHHIRLVEEG